MATVTMFSMCPSFTSFGKMLTGVSDLDVSLQESKAQIEILKKKCMNTVSMNTVSMNTVSVN